MLGSHRPKLEYGEWEVHIVGECTSKCMGSDGRVMTMPWWESMGCFLLREPAAPVVKWHLAALTTNEKPNTAYSSLTVGYLREERLSDEAHRESVEQLHRGARLKEDRDTDKRQFSRCKVGGHISVTFLLTRCARTCGCDSGSLLLTHRIQPAPSKNSATRSP